MMELVAAVMVGVAVAAGGHHTVLLTQDGSVWTWGLNDCGQLGDGSTQSRPAPVRVAGLKGVRGVAAGVAHTLALCNDGSVWAWGSNAFGELGDGSTANRPSPVQVAGLSDVVALAAGDGHSLALKADGSAWAWGRNHRGQLGDGTTTDRPQPAQVQGLDAATAIACGAHHCVALRRDGTALAWGANPDGRLGDGSVEARNRPVAVAGLTDVAAVAAGRFHTVAVKRDGSVFAWGCNWSEGWQLADGTTLDSRRPVRVIGLTDVPASGEPVIPLESPWQPFTDARTLAAGESHTLVIRKDGTVWGWGKNHHWGQLGVGEAEWRASPAKARLGKAARAVAAGKYHSVALTEDGAVWTWGANLHGQLGVGQPDTRPHAVPMRVCGPVEAAR
jgi:alpha-tubulin suppressor-like RCC1 family protein